MDDWDYFVKSYERDCIIKSIMDLMKWPKEKAELWYETDNPNFGGLSPELLVNEGRAHKVRQLINAAKEEF